MLQWDTPNPQKRLVNPFSLPAFLIFLLGLKDVVIVAVNGVDWDGNAGVHSFHGDSSDDGL